MRKLIFVFIVLLIFPRSVFADIEFGQDSAGLLGGSSNYGWELLAVYPFAGLQTGFLRLGIFSAAGMSGGIAYVLDRAGNFGYYLNSGMVETEALTDAGETAFVRGMIERHVQWTGSEYAAAILARWNEEQPRFVKVIPTEYKKVLAGR